MILTLILIHQSNLKLVQDQGPARRRQGCENGQNLSITLSFCCYDEAVQAKINDEEKLSIKSLGLLTLKVKPHLTLQGAEESRGGELRGGEGSRGSHS